MNERDRLTDMPGGCECHNCGCIFVGAPAHDLCGVCHRDHCADSGHAWLVAGCANCGATVPNAQREIVSLRKAIRAAISVLEREPLALDLGRCEALYILREASSHGGFKELET